MTGPHLQVADALRLNEVGQGKGILGIQRRGRKKEVIRERPREP